MQRVQNSILSNDNDILLHEFVESRELESWQKYFCEITGLFACCVDGKGEPLTQMSGDPDEISRIKSVIREEQYQNILNRVTESELEEQAVEHTPVPNLRLGALSVKVMHKPAFSWLICAVLSDTDMDTEVEEGTEAPFTDFRHPMTEAELYKALDWLRDVSYMMINRNIKVVNACAESRRSRYSEREMSESLRRTAAITEVVQLLESDDVIEKIMMDVLQIIVTYLGISCSKICRENREGTAMEIVAEYCSNGAYDTCNRALTLKKYSILCSDKVVAISSETGLNATERRELEEMGLKAIVVMPISLNGTVGLHACFGENRREHVWEVDDIKFLNDTVKILQSIIVKRIQKNSLASSYASLETILDNVGGAVYVRDCQTEGILFANRNMRSTFKKELEDGTLHTIAEGKIQSGSGSTEIYHRDQDRWYDLYYTRINWVDSRPVLLCALYDISDKKVYQRKIEQQAYTDFLTGLYNRMCCERDLAKHVDLAVMSGKAGALLYLDLDDFKHINDGLGHQYGDELLKAISHSLQRIPGIQNTCYRMGGDEFVIIIPYDVYEEQEAIMAGIKDIFAKPWFLKDADYYCTMSMGVVKFPDEGENVHDLIKKADIAMYDAKKCGKNRIAFYSSSSDAVSGKRLDMEKNMRDATADGYHEFQVYYQPIIDIQKSGMPCTGAEALIRWDCQELGFIQPSEFIPLAEYLGLINPIGNHVLKEACLDCRSWNDNGYPEHKVNVNLSVVQLLQADIVEIVAQTIKETGISPKNLTLEVTESLAINDMSRMQEILANIRALGVRIALDDFGTGYSSLNHIREIPFDVIKVDQSFIRDLERDAYSQSFVRMVVELAEAVGANICIEGVETSNQYKILSEMNVSLVQGYYFDKPMPKEDFERKYCNPALSKSKPVNCSKIEKTNGAGNEAVTVN